MLKLGFQKARELGSGPIAKASVISVVVRVGGLPLSFVQAILTARLLGAGNYGTVAVAMAAVQILATFCMFGLPSLAVREIPAALAGDAGRLNIFVRRITFVVFGLSCAASVALAALAATELVPTPYRSALEIGAILVPPIAMIGLLSSVARGFGRMFLSQLPGGVFRPATMILALGTVAILGLTLSANDYMWLAAGAAMISATIGGIWLWRSVLIHLPIKAGMSLRLKYVDALPFLGLTLATIFQGQINTLLLGWLASPREAGLFQPIVRVAPLLLLAVQSAGMQFAPRVAELWQRGEIDRIRAITSTFTWTTTLITFLFALTIALSGPWLMWLFGPEFHETATLLWLICAAQIFNAACGPVGMLLTMSGRSGFALLGELLGLTVNIAIGILMIPNYGAAGAVIAMCMGIVFWNLTMLAMAKARYGFDPSLLGVLLRR